MLITPDYAGDGPIPLPVARKLLQAAAGSRSIVLRLIWRGQTYVATRTPAGLHIAPAPVAPSGGLGSFLEKLVKPVAKFLKLPCLKGDGTLKPGTPCAKRRDALNRLIGPRQPH